MGQSRGLAPMSCVLQGALRPFPPRAGLPPLLVPGVHRLRAWLCCVCMSVPFLVPGLIYSLFLLAQLHLSLLSILIPILTLILFLFLSYILSIIALYSEPRLLRWELSA